MAGLQAKLENTSALNIVDVATRETISSVFNSFYRRLTDALIAVRRIT